MTVYVSRYPIASFDYVVSLASVSGARALFASLWSSEGNFRHVGLGLMSDLCECRQALPGPICRM